MKLAQKSWTKKIWSAYNNRKPTFAHELLALGSKLVPLLKEFGTVGADFVVHKLVEQRVENALEREEVS